MAGGEHGGKGKGDPILSEFIESLESKSPRALYIGAASNDDTYYFSIIEPVLLNSGAKEVHLASFDGTAHSKKLIASSELIFISGGDVESGMANLEAVKAIPILIELYKNGVPFVGVSAGSIMMGKAWIRWKDPDDNATASLFPCLGFTKFACDAHDEFDDWGELKSAMRISPEGETGYGIPTGAALLVEPDSTTPIAIGKPAAVFRSGKRKNSKALELLSPQ